MNWRQSRRDVDQLDRNEAAFAKSRLTENSVGCVAMQNNYIAAHFNVKTASSLPPPSYAKRNIRMRSSASVSKEGFSDDR
jgi:hypothetical protein